MPDVLIRDVQATDLDEIRAAAAEQGTSVQSYLRDALHAQAAYLRRQTGLARTAERLSGRADVPAVERRAVLDAITRSHTERAEQLSEPSSK